MPALINLRHAIGKLLLLHPLRQIQKRQHRDRSFLLASINSIFPKSQHKGNKMTDTAAVSLPASPSGKKTRSQSAILAIATGGLIAGTIDLLQACILFGWKIPLAIAAGLIGPQAFRQGAATYCLGVLLHFFIALSAAAIYYAASRKLPFLREFPLVCGLFFGAAVETIMNLVVLPLSALHARGPYELHNLLLGLGVHMVVVGLPIAYAVRRFAR